MIDPRTQSTLAIAQAAVTRLGSITAAASVCQRAGFRVGRSFLSRYLNNDLSNVTNIEKAILGCFDRQQCPYLGTEVDSAMCVEVNSGPVPTWDPSALDQRRCCQTCAHNPMKGAQQ